MSIKAKVFGGLVSKATVNNPRTILDANHASGYEPSKYTQKELGRAVGLQYDEYVIPIVEITTGATTDIELIKNSGYAASDSVTIYDIRGTVANVLNGNTYTISSITGDTITIPANTTGKTYTGYTGLVVKGNALPIPVNQKSASKLYSLTDMLNQKLDMVIDWVGQDTLALDKSDTPAEGEVLVYRAASVAATATIKGNASLDDATGTSFKLINADGGIVTFTTSPTKNFGDTVTETVSPFTVNTRDISGGSEARKATQAFWISCKAAIDASALNMTIDPTTVDPIASGQEYFTLTQTTSSFAGNTAITLITGVTADGETAFTGGVDPNKFVYQKVDTLQLEDDCINKFKLADDCVFGQHITNGQVGNDEMGDDAVGIAEMADITRGGVIVGDSGDDPSILALGAAGYVLGSDGSDIEWRTIGSTPGYAILDQLKLLPHHFHSDSSRALIFDSTTGGIKLGHAATDMWASIVVPRGYKATEAIIYGNITLNVNVYETDINSAAIGSVIGNANVGSTIDFTDSTGDATNFLVFQIELTDLADIIYGGTIAIELI